MYSTILVPLDGSKRAEAILPHVRELALHYDSSVILLRVFVIPHLTNLTAVSDNDYDAIPHLSRDELQTLVDEAQTYLRDVCLNLDAQGISASYKIAHGPIAATIINTATQQDADLIAMASHGSSGIAGVYYGSVAAGVLQRVDRPLLIVRAYDPD
jgi:nucleotide-binding universal stress UspA family protein